MLTVAFLGTRVVSFLSAFVYFPAIFHKYILTLKLEKNVWNEEGGWPPRYEEGPHFIK